MATCLVRVIVWVPCGPQCVELSILMRTQGCQVVHLSLVLFHLEQWFFQRAGRRPWGARCWDVRRLTPDLHLKAEKSAAQGQSTPATEKTGAVQEQLNPGRRKRFKHVLSCTSIVVHRLKEFYLS